MSNLSLSGNATRHRIADVAVATKRGLALLACLSLSGCLSLGGDAHVDVYSPVVSISPDPAWPTASWPMLIARPSAGDALDSTRIAVRPQANQLQVYKDVVWSDPAPDLLQGELVQAFEDSGKLVSVGRQSSGIRGDFVLLIELRHFESIYDAKDGAPHVLVELHAKLVANPGNRVLATRTFRSDVAAANEKIPAVLAAFDSALSQSLGDIVGWTLVTGQANAQNVPVGK